MAGRSKPSRRWTIIEPWRIVLLLVGAILFALLAVGRMPSRELHEAVLTSLRAIDGDHAALQRDVLQARAGLLLNYDPLVDSIVRLRASVARLHALFDAAGMGETVQLDRQLAAISRSIDADEALVETFKTSNALLQNSLSIAVQLLDRLDQSPDARIRQALGQTGDLGLPLMRFTAQPDGGLAGFIRHQLDALQASPAGADADIRSFAAHVRTVLSTLPQVDAVIEAIQLSHSSREAQILQRDYLEAFGEVSAQAVWSRALLGAISVLLCGYVAVLIYRLRAQTQRLARQLDFENIVAEVRRRFVEGGEDMPTAFAHSVELFGSFFQARSHAFAVLNSDDFRVEHAYGNIDGRRLQSIASEYGPRFAATAHRGGSDYLGFPYNERSDPHRAWVHGVREGSIVMGWFGERSVSLFLVRRGLPGRSGDHEQRMYGNAALVLARSLMTYHTREEKKALEARLEHAQRLEAVGTLAGGIAHEFNNSLAAILGYAEMTLQLKRVSTQGRQYLQQIVASAQRARHVTDQILTFGRKRERVAKPFNMAEAVSDILPLIRLSVPDGIRFDVALAEHLPSVLGNPIEVQQVVMNLCTNAVHALSDDGVVRIGVRAVERPARVPLSHGELPAGRYVVLSVGDTGSGIDANVLPHIFEPFFTTRANKGGTGLGLAAVHGIVAGMSGHIDVASRPGRGTRFDVHFPAAGNRAAVPLSDFFHERSTPLGHGQTVLLVQRDGKLRLMYEEKIAALGYEPVGFADGRGLCDWLGRDRRAPDLIMMDLDTGEQAPDLSALMQRLAPVPLLLLAEPAQITADLRTTHGTALLRKPVSTMHLAAAIASRIAAGGRGSPAGSVGEPA
ncbi:two-component system VirA-like sensor kinase [Ancylobacter sp. Lp-2]|uniref:two-component system VirA-like sensor kinase n=1 Tax=Ancylobacter sp. Lp-2 TaxID=2881339 RepID=UPI001E5D2F9D|nr:two-component system VirA-like sensor kinase [Ancylobacter sp. Lp-2]MCB4769728.1 two-component system VirA-like sensor kinase [Ancylobacter sp. Lp-2]